MFWVQTVESGVSSHRTQIPFELDLLIIPNQGWSCCGVGGVVFGSGCVLFSSEASPRRAIIAPVLSSDPVVNMDRVLLLFSACSDSARCVATKVFSNSSDFSTRCLTCFRISWVCFRVLFARVWISASSACLCARQSDARWVSYRRAKCSITALDGFGSKGVVRM